MSNTKKIASIAFTGAAAAAMTLTTTPNAAVASPVNRWQVTIPPHSFWKSEVAASLHAGTSFHLKDTNTGASLTCPKNVFGISIPASIVTGTVAKLGFVLRSVTRWSSCTAAGAFRFREDLTTSPNLIAESYNTTTGVTTGKLSGNKISAKISGIAGNTCRATISGTSIPIKYTNNTHSLSVNPGNAVTLHVKQASGNCMGKLRTGDNAYIHGLYHVATPTGLAISRV